MEIHWTPPAFLIYLVVFVLGYVVGLFEGRWRHGRIVQKLKDERDAARKEAEEARAALEKQGPPARSSPKTGLWLDGKSLQLDGDPLTRETLTPARRKRLLALLGMIAPLLKNAPSQKGPKNTASPARSAPPQTAASPSRAPAVPASAPLRTHRTLSIVEQIDEILQSLLEGTPLEERGIRLQEAPDGSVQVWIGLQRYDSVETVPDAEVRRVIQRAIKTWEQRHA